VIYAQHNPTQHALAIARNHDALPTEMRRKLLDFFVTKACKNSTAKKPSKDEDAGNDDLDDGQGDDYEEEVEATKKNKKLQKEHRGLLPCMRYTTGMRVMLTRNIQTSLGLTNGATGTIVGFLYDNHYTNDIIHVSKDVAAAAPPPIPAILVQFDKLSTPGWKGEEGVVPVFPVEESLHITNRHGTVKGKALITRTMVPLVQAKAMTIHKSQGASFDGAVINPMGIFQLGQA
jgi:hypothetical protein